jgi:hypothetical protein
MQFVKNTIQCTLLIATVLLAITTGTWGWSNKKDVDPNRTASGDFDFLSLDPIKIQALGTGEIKLHAEIVNLGDEADTYDLSRVENLPPQWYSALCIGGEDGFCLRPDVDTFQLTLNPAEKDSFSAYIYPQSMEGGGSVTLTVQSRANPALLRSLEFVGITSGTDVLVVDDDGEQLYEEYYEEALNGDVTFGTWIRCCKEITSIDLNFFETVIWETGEASPTLSLSDIHALSAYLDGGGNLFLSGQDIGWSLCDPASPDFSETPCDFYHNYLHATYQANSADDFTLSGVAGDAVSHGLDIEISGEGGANNQTSPSVVSPIGPAREVFMYDETHCGAVRVETGTYKVVYFAFGFEAINNENTRQRILGNILNRFAYDGEKGDMDNNGSLDVIDLILNVNIILSITEPTPNELWQGDFNNDGGVDVLDLIDMVNAILG